MKNVHLLPTDKPSRLVKFFTNKFHLCKEILPIQDEEQYQNTYITSNDEEIKEGDWALDLCEDLGLKYQPFKVDKATLKYANQECKKIILTTDQDLIADGVQAINDEFLEWFVKNPSCERVEVENEWEGNGTMFGFKMGNVSPDGTWRYQIIIPKEEPKQGTLEEVAENESEYLADYDDKEMYQKGFIDGAKWQQEQDKKMYSEEDIQSAWEDGRNGENEWIGSYPFFKKVFKNKNFKEWFEQFKMK